MEHQTFDILLFNRIKRNDRLALNTLFTRYYEKLCRFSYLYVRNREESEEIVSDVFLNLWNRKHSLNIEKNLRAYLFTSVKHAACAIIKARKPDTVNIDDMLFDSHLAEYNDPEQWLTFKELEWHVEKAINTLPPRCKQIFLLKWVEDLTYREISEILGIAEKTVENQLVKAVSIIKDSVNVYQQQDLPISRLTQT